MRRVLLLSAVILTALILQTTVFSEVNLLGAKPELMYLLTICFATFESGSARASITCDSAFVSAEVRFVYGTNVVPLR